MWTYWKPVETTYSMASWIDRRYHLVSLRVWPPWNSGLHSVCIVLSYFDLLFFASGEIRDHPGHARPQPSGSVCVASTIPRRCLAAARDGVCAHRTGRYFLDCSFRDQINGSICVEIRLFVLLCVPFDVGRRSTPVMQHHRGKICDDVLWC